jgi:hypothetical protein
MIFKLLRIIITAALLALVGGSGIAIVGYELNIHPLFVMLAAGLYGYKIVPNIIKKLES